MLSKRDGLRLFAEIRATWRQFSAAQPSTHASSISYYTFLSLVPILALCISLISLAGVDQRAVQDFLAAFVPDALSGLADTLVSDAFDRSGLAFSVSTLSLIWSASKGAKALRAGLNAAYDERENRGAVALAIISILAVVAMGVLIAGAMWMIFGNSVLHSLAQHLPELQVHDSLLELADLIAILTAGMLMFALCYTFLPAGNRSFRAQLPGAACALAGCGALSFGFRVYVDHFSNFTVLYGSIATIALLLFWMYLVFYIVIACAFVNRYLHARATERGRHKVTV